MGKGDRKTKRGKIVKGTYGVIRPKKKYKAGHKKNTPAASKKEKSEK